MLRDIENRADLEMLMREFYNKLLVDDSIAYIFTDVAKIDLESHLPILADFWESVLLYSSAYKGNVMLKHIELDKKSALTKAHFERWTALFYETLDEHFRGPIADEAKRRAQLMGDLMQFKISASRNKGFLQ